MRVHFTDITIRTFKPGAYWDDSTPGFGVRVGKRAKTWTVMRGLNRERVTIGRYPDLPLTDARKEAKRLLSEEPQVKISCTSFEKAKATFLAENYRDARPRTAQGVKRLLDRHFKALNTRSLDTLNDQDIKKQLDRLAGTPSEQLHAYRAVRCFLTWCTRPPRRYIRHSPMEGYQPPSKDRKGTRILTDAELQAVWTAADSPPHAVVRLLILWGTRNTETAVSERTWLVDGVLTIPGTATKNGRAHSIPLLPLAKHTLSLFPEGRYFVHSRWGNDHLSDGAWSKIKREVQKASNTKNWQLRDLRRTFRSSMARLKVPRDLCEVLINHAPPVLDEIYDRYDRLDEKRAALAKYERWLQSILKA
jgi:hypothetical protein